MMVASIEATLEPWASSLRDVKARMRSPFTQERVAVSAGQFLDGLPGDERRKTGWMRAEAAGDPGPWRQQAILGRGRWDADALRDIVREYTLETPSDADAVLVIDGTGFLKQGKASCGVARQHAGSAGKITNCRIGVLAACVSRHGHAFIDRALHLPKVWTGRPAWLARAHVATTIGLATKPAIGGCDDRAGCGSGRCVRGFAQTASTASATSRRTLRRAGKGHVPGVSSNHHFGSWIDKPAVAGTAVEIARDLDPAAWHRLSAGDGTKGARLHEWASRTRRISRRPSTTGGARVRGREDF